MAIVGKDDHMKNSTCTASDCNRKSIARKLCTKHYQRYMATGSTHLETMKDRFWVKVDKNGPIPELRPDLGACWEWTAAKTKHGYGMFGYFRNGERAMVGAHRVSYEFANGSIPDHQQIDHRCHNASCVNPDHLRLATSKQNGENLSGAYRNSKSGIRGVSWNTKRQVWVATVRHLDKHVHVGYFDNVTDAEAAAIIKRNELFTHNDYDRSIAG